MHIFLPHLAARRQALNAKRDFNLIELLVACHPKLQRRKATPGFTLIELLVVIGILTILLAIVLIAVNPARQFSQANDTQRRSDVNAILNAIHQYAADNKGALPAGIDTTVRTICTPTATCAVSAVNLCSALTPKYLANLPRDPLNGTVTPSGNGSCDATTTAYNTIYTVVSTGAAAGNRITVTATPEITPPATISVTR